MDIQETISRARKEYKDYLRERHPDWAESTLSTHVSDAFYLYQNTIALSFWKCFESPAIKSFHHAGSLNSTSTVSIWVRKNAPRNALPLTLMISRCSKSSWMQRAV